MHQAEISGRYYDKIVSFHREFPSSWDELTESHLNDIAEVLVSDQPENKHHEMILFRWLKIPFAIFFHIDPAYKLLLAEKLTFLYEKNMLSKVLCPKITHNGIDYHGPKDAFINISFIEWVLGETSLKKYQANKSDEALNEIVWTMYRPFRNDITEQSTNYKGDLREVVNESNYDIKARVFKSLSPKDKMKVLITFIGNRNSVMHRFAPVFEDVDRKAMHNPYEWAGILVDMTGSKWTTREQVENEKAYNVFINWHQNIIRMEEWEMENNIK